MRLENEIDTGMKSAALHTRLWIHGVPLPPGRWARALLWVLGRLLVLTMLVLGHARTGRAGGFPIPERVAHLCAHFGKAEGCTLLWGPQKVKGTLVISVAEGVSDPDVPPSWPGVMALMLTLTIPHRESVSAIYQYNEGTTCDEVSWNLQQPPCFSPSCVAERESDPSYVGPHEADLVDAAFVNNLLYQQPDAAVSARLRALTGATGDPTVRLVSKKAELVSDGRGDARATTYTKQVSLGFLVGAE